MKDSRDRFTPDEMLNKIQDQFKELTDLKEKLKEANEIIDSLVVAAEEYTTVYNEMKSDLAEAVELLKDKDDSQE